ncbi:phage N-6-adenine-methyltransferase [Cronobacter sakazakii]
MNTVERMNPYCQALAELRSRGAHELKEVGDQWRTPDNIFWGINAMFGPLVLDLFSDGENSKCEAYYTAEDNALTQDWSARLAELNGAAYGNPPYSRASQHEGEYITGMRYIMQHASAMREKGGRYVFLIKAATSEVWWPEDADHVAFIRGRIGFDLPLWFIPKNEKQVPTGAFFAGAVVVFDKTWRGPAMSYISRNELEARGDAFLSQIRREAERMLASTAPRVVENVTPAVEEDPQPEEKAEQVEPPSEPEFPLSSAGILAQSGVEVWACAQAAFGAKEQYAFHESRFAHSWAADSVEQPSLVTVTTDVINRALGLIRKHNNKVKLEAFMALNDFAFEDDAARHDTQERLAIVADEAEQEYSLAIEDFLRVAGSIEPKSWNNIRVLRACVRAAVETREQVA